MRTIRAAAICALLVGSLGQQAYGQQWSWKKIEYPGATNTMLTAISGEIAIGQWCGRSQSVWHQFLYNSRTNTYTSWEDPWYHSWLTGISGSDLIGNYVDGNVPHGILYRGDGGTITLDVPWPEFVTTLSGISGNTIVGSLYGEDGINHGCIYDKNDFSWWFMNYPGAYSTGLIGVSSTGGIIGMASSTDGYHPFFYKDGQWTNLQYPGSSGLTVPRGISGDMIVGSYGVHSAGFLFDGTSWTTLAYPGAGNADAYGIDGNQIVGCYSDGTHFHGFLLTVPEPASLALLVLGGLLVLRHPRGR